EADVLDDLVRVADGEDPDDPRGGDHHEREHEEEVEDPVADRFAEGVERDGADRVHRFGSTSRRKISSRLCWIGFTDTTRCPAAAAARRSFSRASGLSARRSVSAACEPTTR